MNIKFVITFYRCCGLTLQLNSLKSICVLCSNAMLYFCVENCLIARDSDHNINSNQTSNDGKVRTSEHHNFIKR